MRGVHRLFDVRRRTGSPVLFTGTQSQCEVFIEITEHKDALVAQGLSPIDGRHYDRRPPTPLLCSVHQKRKRRHPWDGPPEEIDKAVAETITCLDGS